MMAESEDKAPLDPQLASTMPAESTEATIEPKHNTASGASDKSKDISLPKSSKSVHVPHELVAYTAKTDELLLRLNKLLSSKAGLGSFLSTLNYALYFLRFVTARSPSTAQLRLLLLSRLRPSHAASSSTSSSIPTKSSLPTQLAAAAAITPATSIATLATLISKTRTSLRLLGLLPLYSWLRSLLLAPPPSDIWTYRISLVQCLAYIGFQSLENVAHLIDTRILAVDTRLNPFRRSAAPSKNLMLWSCRCWLVGVAADIVRLLRQAQLETARRRPNAAAIRAVGAKEVDDFDRRWWREMTAACCWMPLCVHWSFGGLPGINDAVVGILGTSAGWATFVDQWRATKA